MFHPKEFYSIFFHVLVVLTGKWWFLSLLGILTSKRQRKSVWLSMHSAPWVPFRDWGHPRRTLICCAQGWRATAGCEPSNWTQAQPAVAVTGEIWKTALSLWWYLRINALWKCWLYLHSILPCILVLHISLGSNYGDVVSSVRLQGKLKLLW